MKHPVALVAVLALWGCNSSNAPSPEPSASTARPEAAAEATVGATASPAAAPPARGLAVAGAKAELGKPAPDFTLTDLTGKEHRSSDHRGKIVVLEWFNPGCPFVRQSHEKGTLKGMAAEYADRGVVWLAINSGAPGKQGTGKEVNAQAREDFGMGYPVLLDETGEVGRAYGAERTPHMYVIDPKGVLVYRGAIDNTSGGDREDVPEVENHVARAIQAVEAGGAVETAETQAFGCTVKYPK